MRLPRRNTLQAENNQILYYIYFKALEGTNWVIQVLSQNCGIGLREAKNIIEMFEDDCTVPFIVRYRGDRTGNMDADKIRQIKQYYTNLM